MWSEVWRDLKWQVQVRRDAVVIILLIQVGVFVGLGLLRLGGWLVGPSGSGVDWLPSLGLPADFSEWLRRPWTVVTYAWVHAGFWHLLFNGLIFYWFGRFFEDLVGQRRLVTVFIGGMLTGAVAYWLMGWWKGWHGYMIGGSAAVMAVMAASATLTPDRRLYLLLIGPVKIAYIAVALLLLDLIAMPLGNPGGHVAHLGGALFGFFYVRWMQGRWPFYLSAVRRPAWRPPQQSAQQAHQMVMEVDRILEKVVREGMDSLSERERRILQEASEQYRRGKK